MQKQNKPTFFTEVPKKLGLRLFQNSSIRCVQASKFANGSQVGDHCTL